MVATVSSFHGGATEERESDKSTPILLPTPHTQGFVPPEDDDSGTEHQDMMLTTRRLRSQVPSCSTRSPDVPFRWSHMRATVPRSLTISGSWRCIVSPGHFPTPSSHPIGELCPGWSPNVGSPGVLMISCVPELPSGKLLSRPLHPPPQCPGGEAHCRQSNLGTTSSLEFLM